MLWVMRRDWMKRIQRGMFALIPATARASVYRRHVRQNRFARRYGLRILTMSLNLLLGTILLCAVYLTATEMYVAGVFNPPVK